MDASFGGDVKRTRFDAWDLDPGPLTRSRRWSLSTTPSGLRSCSAGIGFPQARVLDILRVNVMTAPDQAQPLEPISRSAAWHRYRHQHYYIDSSTLLAKVANGGHNHAGGDDRTRSVTGREDLEMSDACLATPRLKPTRIAECLALYGSVATAIRFLRHGLINR